MLNSILLNSTSTITTSGFVICTTASVVLGVLAALIYMYRNVYSKNFVVTLALLPVMVQTVIMLVNGNLGAGVAVAGTFSLVRFRSVAGGAREIGSIFLAMALGLATGMGYVMIAGILLAVYALISLLLLFGNFGETKANMKDLKITISEGLDYTGIFDELFEKYTKKVTLFKVKTTNMGSMFDLYYHVILNDASQEKDFIDKIRCQNGNLPIVCAKASTVKDEL